MPKTPAPSLNRRTALAGAGAVGAAAAAAALIPGAPQAPVANASTPKTPEAGGGYQLSQHVLRYYQTAKV